MTTIAIRYPGDHIRLQPSSGLIVLALVALGLLMVDDSLLPWASSYPKAWTLPVAAKITAAMKWLLNDADFGLFTFKEMTRGLGALLDAPTLFLKGLLATGFKFELESGESLRIPPLSWIAVTADHENAGMAIAESDPARE